MKKTFVICAILTAFMLGIAYAHGGDTDSNGGHYDRGTGVYHYHHGYPAHYHIGGECPYNYVDKTGWNSGSAGSGRQKKQNNGFDMWFWVVAIVASTFVAYSFAKSLQRDKEERQKKEEQLRARLEKEKKEREEERRKRIELYSTNDLETISGVPEMYVIGRDGLPVERDKEEHEVYGKTLEVYINGGNSSYSYHRKECRYAKRMVNILDPKYNFHARDACGSCRPIKQPDGDWFKKYLEAEKMCAELGVTPKHRN